MAKKTKKTAKTLATKLNIPGFNGEASLGPAVSLYRGRMASGADGKVMLQLGLQSTVRCGLGRLLEMQGERWR